MTTAQPMVRALYRSVPITGTGGARDCLFAKVYYPALYGGTEAERNTGFIPLARRAHPYPVAVIMPGINVSPEAYGWIATALAEAGLVTLLYGWILEEMPGLMSLSPGLDLSALAPPAIGTRPSSTALGPLLQELQTLNASGVLAGQLDLDRILLGGHSAGGSMALLNARPDWFPGLRAVFSYGAHAKASTALGYSPDALMPLPSQLPTLMLGGSEDGVIAASAFRYGDNGDRQPDATGPLVRSFREALSSRRGDCHLAIVRGANHFSFAWPTDAATGRPFLDHPVTRPDEDLRRDLAALITAFAQAHVAGDAAASSRLSTLLSDPHRFALAESR